MSVSITGMTVHSWRQAPLFFRHAIPSLHQARRVWGNLFADVRKVAGVQHTLTVWDDALAYWRINAREY